MRARLALAAALSLAPGAARADLTTVLDCVEANTPRISSVLNVSIQVKDEGEDGFRSRLKLYWRKLRDGEQRILLRFQEPEDLEDAGVLVTAKPEGRPTVHIYLPEQGKPRSVLSRHELEGFLGQANLGIEELEMLVDPIGGGNVALLREDDKLGERAVWVLEERNDGDSRYARTLTFIDRELCIPLRAEFQDGEDVTQKTLVVDLDGITRVVESWVPRRLVFHDLRLASDTELELEDVEVDAAFSPALLTVKALPGPGR